MTKDELVQLAHAAAVKHGIDPQILKALCHHESKNWKQYAFRWEPDFYDRYVSTMKLLTATEKQARAFSYGLGQIMGQTAREFGFTGDDLSELFEPATNLEFVCRKLARCFKDHPNDLRKTLLSYNGGQNLAYPDLVLRHMDEYK